MYGFLVICPFKTFKKKKIEKLLRKFSILQNFDVLIPSIIFVIFDFILH